MNPRARKFTSIFETCKGWLPMLLVRAEGFIIDGPPFHFSEGTRYEYRRKAQEAR